jgi:hypothetical protein
MRKAACCTAVLALAVTAIAFAQARPDFSGTWTLDPARSVMGGGPGGRGPGGPGGPGPAGPMTVRQTATELVREISRGERTMTMAYKLDGSESTNAMGPMTSKSTASWNGEQLVIKTVRDTPNGTMETTETWSLGAGGNELMIVTATPRGERKMVYVKK